MIVKEGRPQCSECGEILEKIRPESNLSKNPKYAYYYRTCCCYPKDKMIIRIPIKKLEYEIVGTFGKNIWDNKK